uniref:Uncharacterized protein n=1 Tax=Romanomermis culicivorax TaxID=13658 RepID=A0A915KTT6_ROMCU
MDATTKFIVNWLILSILLIPKTKSHLTDHLRYCHLYVYDLDGTTAELTKNTCRAYSEPVVCERAVER